MERWLVDCVSAVRVEYSWEWLLRGVLLVGKAAGRGGVVEARCWVLREQP